MKPKEKEFIKKLAEHYLDEGIIVPISWSLYYLLV